VVQPRIGLLSLAKRDIGWSFVERHPDRDPESLRPPDTDVVSHWLITTQGQLWSHYQYVQKGRSERPPEIEYRRITHGRVEWETVAVVRSQVLKWLGRQG
jgi:hypothetical protein